MRKSLVTVLLLLAMVLVLWVSYVVGGQRTSAGDEAFGGTDAQVTGMLEDQGVEPWFDPVFEPGSSELESGLFAAQAGLGGIVLGYCVGRLHGRHRSRETDVAQRREHAA